MTVGLEAGLRTGPEWKTELYYKVKDKTKNSDDEAVGQNED